MADSRMAGIGAEVSGQEIRNSQSEIRNDQDVGGQRVSREQGAKRKEQSAAVTGPQSSVAGQRTRGRRNA